ncbi:hypothetical protein [Tuberibacillus sp. Marseille-P3662]|uniref:hypothetical protein n=1 Tax=Tuberibacillus sp. Marseille-P3662 TaxID=1965358 RepID=UPI000A1C99B9|nr:hypothetical protein [Tuberibacillus sp. Marseille-P3662]
MTKNEQVMQWVRDNFDMEHITIEKTDILPYGHMIKDQEGGHMIAFYDLLYDRVDYRFPDEGRG